MEILNQLQLKKGAMVVIYDTNGKKIYIYGSSFGVDVKENGEWIKPKVLMMPIIGWILIFVFAFCSEENVNVRNLARSRVCVLVAGGIIYLIIALW